MREDRGVAGDGERTKQRRQNREERVSRGVGTVFPLFVARRSSLRRMRPWKSS